MRVMIWVGVLMVCAANNLAAGPASAQPTAPRADALLMAVKASDGAALQQALSAGAPLETRNPRGQTALLLAVWADDLEAVQRLVAAGADVNARDLQKDSPYLVAGAEGRTEILRLLLASGADLTSTNRFGGTALIPAAEKGHPEAVALLIAAGVELDHVNDLGWTALLETVILTRGGPVHQRILGQLLAAGANPDIQDHSGVSALEHARRRGFAAMVRQLSEAGAASR